MKRYLIIAVLVIYALSHFVRADDVVPAGGGGFGDDDPHGECELGNRWKTVDTVDLPGVLNASVFDLATNSKVIVAAGITQTLVNQQDVNQWFVRRSTNGGKSWETAESGQAGFVSSVAEGVAAGPKSDIYVAGVGLETLVSPARWVVRKSENGGRTWTTVDDFAGPAGSTNAIAHDVAVDGSGNVVVVGTVVLPGGATPAAHWWVRRSTNGGASWDNVDDFNLETNRLSIASAVAASKSGRIFVVGVGQTAATNQSWVVRYSDDGLSWFTVDVYQLVTGQRGDANGVAINPKDGRVVVTGQSRDSSLNDHWITREASLVNPFSWDTIDDFNTQGTNPNSEGSSATFSREGELFTSGSLSTGFGGEDFSTYATRREKFFGNGFFFSDRVRVPGGDGRPGTFNQAITRAKSGDLFTGGMILGDWTIRKLKCE